MYHDTTLRIRNDVLVHARAGGIMARSKKATVQIQAQGIIYTRVSTDRQDADRQVADCMKYAQDAGIAITRTVEETISSRKADRQVFVIVDSLHAGDCLIVTELSRLGRSMIELSGIVSGIVQKGAVLHVVSGSVHVIDASIQAQVYLFAFSLAAQVERDLISDRTRSALRGRKAAGVKLGRPEGSRKGEELAREKGIDEKTIKTMIDAGASTASIARILGCDSRTAKKYIDSLALVTTS